MNTVNAEEYIRIFTDFVNQLTDDELSHGYFQEDSAKCHTSRASMREIESFFKDRIISKNLWPPRFPDLTPPNFFLWVCLKGKVYRNRPRTIAELKDAIRREIEAITEETLIKVFRNLERRVQTCSDEGGDHFQHQM